MSEQHEIIRWEAPPPSPRGRRSGSNSAYQAAADAMRSRPGQWAVLLENGSPSRSALANHIRQGSILAFAPAGEFDATSRTCGGQTTVYARYLGDGAA